MIRPALGAAIAIAGLLPIASPGRDTTITVYGWVADEHGRPVSDVGVEDVDVLVDGTPVPVQAVSPPAHGLSLVLLLDTSRSVHWDGDELGAQLTEFARALGHSDRIMLSTVGGRAVSQPFRRARTDWRDDVRRALDLDGEEGYGASPLWDDLHEAVTILTREPAPRAVLLLSDGRATGNRHGLAEIADYAMIHGVSLNVVAKHASQRIRQSRETAMLVQPTAPLRAVSIYTGGQLFVYPDRQREASQLLFSSLAGSLTALHAFNFTPPLRDGAPHQMQVRSKRQRHRVHAPTAFLAPPG